MCLAAMCTRWPRPAAHHWAPRTALCMLLSVTRLGNTYVCAHATLVFHYYGRRPALRWRQVPFGETLRAAEGPDAEPHVSIAARPNADNHAVYSEMVPRFAALEQTVIEAAS